MIDLKELAFGPGELAVAYCDPETERKTMDPALVKAFTEHANRILAEKIEKHGTRLGYLSDEDGDPIEWDTIADTHEGYVVCVRELREK